jgi:uncharacterized membrane protein YccF (DUF307 family)
MRIQILLGWLPGEHPRFLVTRYAGSTTGGDMRLVLNIIWLVFGGLWMAVGYLAAALISFLLIITIPFGFASLRIASYALWPFGRTIVDKPTAGTGTAIGNVIWVLLFGIWLAIGHLVSAAAMAVTIIGILLALANLKLIPVSLMPLGKEIVPVGSPAPFARVPG